MTENASVVIHECFRAALHTAATDTFLSFQLQNGGIIPVFTLVFER